MASGMSRTTQLVASHGAKTPTLVSRWRVRSTARPQSLTARPPGQGTRHSLPAGRSAGPIFQRRTAATSSDSGSPVAAAISAGENP